MFQPHNPHSHPPPDPQPDHRPDKSADPRPSTGKSLPTPCVEADCQPCRPLARQARASSGMAPYLQRSDKEPAIAHAPSRTLGSQPGSIHCMLCDSSGHAHGTVRLIFAPQAPLHYRQGQILQVLLPNGQGPEILITSQPRDSGMMHGRLLLGPGEALPAQFGPDAAFGWMFQVCLRHKRRAH